MWGLDLGVGNNFRFYWGARAILASSGNEDEMHWIDLLWDRMTFKKSDEDDDPKEFFKWVETEGMKYMRKLAKDGHFDHSRAKRFRTGNAKYYIEADTRASGGYLYIGAMERK